MKKHPAAFQWPGIGLKIYTAKKGGQERRKLEEKLAEIREFVEVQVSCAAHPRTLTWKQP